MYARTIIVSPVPGDAAASGAALVKAIAGVKDASATNPYLIKIEPGQFDVSGHGIKLLDHVDVEGSGKDATTIIGNTDPVVLLANDELRQLRVRFVAQASYTDAIRCNFLSAASIRDVTVEIPTTSFIVWGISAFQTNLTLESSTVIGSTNAAAGSFAAIWGADIGDGGDSTVHNLTVQITSQGDATSVGLSLADNTTVTVRDSAIHIDSNLGDSMALFISKTSATLDDVTAISAQTTGGYGLLGSNGDNQAHTIDIERSTISGLFSAVAFANEDPAADTTVQIGASQVDGLVSDFDIDMPAAVWRCADDYGASFQPLAATCLTPAKQSLTGDGAPGAADGPLARVASARAAQQLMRAHAEPAR
jgi:hypothetical protein